MQRRKELQQPAENGYNQRLKDLPFTRGMATMYGEHKMPNHVSVELISTMPNEQQIGRA
jgi:hypothetical protein